MKTNDSLPKSQKNYYIDLAALVPFLMLLFTGFIMLMYHAGTPKFENILSRDGHFWLNTHIVFAVISLILIAVHLSLHLNWFKKLFSAKKKNKYWIRNLILVILFLTTTFTSAIPLILGESETAKMLLGIHNKFGLLLIVFFLIHLLTYSKWLFNMTKKYLKQTHNLKTIKHRLSHKQ